MTDLRTSRIVVLGLAAMLVAPFAARAQAVVEPAAAAPSSAPLTIDQAVAASMDLNYDLLKARLQMQTSVQDQVLAKSVIFPSVNFNASLGAFRVGESSEARVDPATGLPVPVRDASSSGSFGAGLSIRQLVFDGGKWWNNLEAADKAWAAAKEQIEEQRLQTIFTVRQRFYEMVRAQRQLEVLKEAAQRSRDQADWTQRLYEGGRATQADVYAARANRDNDEVNRLGQEAKVESARQDLAIAIGRDPTAPLNVVEPPELQQDIAAAPAAQEAVDRALTQRPSLKAYGYQLQSLEKQVEAAKGDYWPTVTLNAQYQRNTNALKPFLASPEKENTISGAVNLNWNLFAGFSTRANVEKARIQVLLTQNDYLNGKRGVASDVEKAIASWAAARTQARVAQQLEENSVKNLTLAKARQEVGVGTQLEVRDAELKVTQAKLARVGALVDGREAEAALHRAAGDI